MARFENWPVLLGRYINECYGRPFVRGDFDCALFAADAVKIMTGKDFAADFRGRYKSERGAKLALRKYGAGTLKDTVSKCLGPPMQNIKMAGRGDIALVNYQGSMAIGVIDGGVIYCVHDRGGLCRISFKDALCAWSV